MKQKSSDDEYINIVKALESEEPPQPRTLVAAKSRGKLINLCKDGQYIFVELERVFRLLFPSSVINVSFSVYSDKCISNGIIQDCFHNLTHNLINDHKEKVLLDIIFLFFKVRVHHKCKCIIEQMRNKKHTSKKETALRSKLAK